MSFIKSKSKLLVIVMLFILVFGVGTGFASTDADDSVGVAGDVNTFEISNNDDSISIENINDDIAVSSADTEAVSLIENINNKDINSNLSKSDSNVVLTAADGGSFTALKTKLQNIADGSTIELDNDYNWITGDDSSLLMYFNYKKNIVIDGKGHYINSNGHNIHFVFSRSSNIEVKNINFKNIVISSAGNNGLTDSDNKGALGSQTGLIILNGCNQSSVNNCNFTNVTGGTWANCISLSGYAGYCLYNTIKNCNFKQIRGSAGGPLYTGGHVESIKDGSLVQYLLIDNCNFYQTYGSGRGGSMELNCRYATVSNCNFTNCSARNMGVISLYNTALNATITNCRFINNSASAGGAISAETAGIQNTKIISCYFEGNKATTTNGGAVLLNGENGSISNCIFINNYAKGNGGAVSFGAPSGSIIDSSFMNNNATKYGGAVYANAQNSLVNHCTFENNVADDGNNFYATAGNPIIITNCGFDLFYVSDDGTGDGLRIGAPTSFANAVQSIENGGRIILIGTFTNLKGQNVGKPVIIEGYNNQVVVNLAGLNNRAFTITASDVTVKGIIFKNSLITGNGGVILWNGANGVVDDCTFENNTAANGGAIYWAGTKGKVIGSTFNKNTATANGGAVYWTGNDGSIDDSTFTNNKAVYGSAIFLKDGVSVFELKDTSFTSNVASTSGTVAAEKLTTFSLGGNSFSSNTVSSGDTDYYFYDNAPVITSALVYVSTTGSATSNGFTSSTPTTWAHAIQIIEEGGKIIFLNGNYDLGELTISKSIALVGSGNTVFNSNRKNRYFTINANNVTVENIIFNNGKASGNGGAIVWNGANGQVISSTFTSNQATGSGGAIYWTGANGKIDKSTFTGNTGSNGNALSSTKAVSVSNSVLQNQITLSLTGTVNYGTDEVVTGTFQSNPASSVTVYLDDATQGSVSVSSNKFTKSLSRVSVGTYTIGVKDNNGNTYTFTSGNTFTVNRLGTVYISPSGTGTGASSSSPTTWDKVADIITDSGTVIFTAGTYTDFYGKTISKSWTLKNSGTVILNANNKGRIFSITANNVNIEGFTFQNGKVTTGSGGAIYNTGTGVTIKNSIFTGNSAPTANIISSTKAITITNSQLKNPFTITTNSINYGAAETIVITFPSGTAPSKGTIKLNGEEKGTYDVTSNQLQASISGLAVGSYVVTQLIVIFKEDL